MNISFVNLFVDSQVKENICREGFVVDKEDSSLTRSDEYMLELFSNICGATVLLNMKQRNFPRELFDVRMYAIKP
jgi:protein N-terminal methyltransferase